MLAAIATGASPTLMVQIARIAGKKQEAQTARTMLALLRQKMLRHAKSGGLEISEDGLAAVAKATARAQRP